MRTKSKWSPGPGIKVQSIAANGDGDWIVSAYLARFARVLRRDIEAVCNAIDLPWSNGQAEGQINRLKNDQARHVWPSGCRASQSTDDADQIG